MSISISLDLTTVYEQLRNFANQNNFWQSFEAVYGVQYNIARALALQSQWQRGNFNQLPPIKIFDSSILDDINGVYVVNNNTIYLSDSFVKTASKINLISVILEEIGHFVNAQVHRTDTH